MAASSIGSFTCGADAPRLNDSSTRTAAMDSFIQAPARS
jgi:hypothetical protein